MNFPFTKQYDAMDCGPSCLRMIASSYGRDYSLESLRNQSYITKEGVNLLGISEAAENIGFRTLAVKVPLKKLVEHAPFPCILHWNQNHFIVLYKVTHHTFSPLRLRRRGVGGEVFHIADPGHGLKKLKKEDFIKSWQGNSSEGIALLLEPTEAFYENKKEDSKNKKGWRFLLHYIRPYKKFIAQLFLSMLVGSAISLVLPFLTQSMVDNGINAGNLGFIQLILLSQLLLFFGSTAIEAIRAWLMIHLNSRINISIISDFLMKLMRLPIKYFDTKLIGDIKQRIADHNRIQSFLTGSVLTTVFSLINLVIFSVVLAIYNWKILLVFAAFSIIGIGWIILFLRKRKQLDYVRFQRMGENENVLYELITGMQEIKLNNCERIKRWGWERVQAKLFKLGIKSLALGQTQQIGSSFFNQLKNILISYMVAREVVKGNMTLGMMMSVSYIIGQLNSPIQLLLGFIQSAQDAKISLDRLSEIHNREDEEISTQHRNLSLIAVKEKGDIAYETFIENGIDIDETSSVNSSAIKLNNISYQYTGPKSPYVLKNVNVTIPQGKVTAIVGTSGSGKTTLMKLLLNFYEPTEGSISVNGIALQEISPSYWRSKCGIVMQDGFIFSDTIANNISMSDEKANHAILKHAVAVSNIKEFIDELPMNYNTMIGASGNGISAGQRQRMLIARAVYKNPDYLFFDEATSALDANNERTIMQNLEEFYKGRTVVVIAHRLSTVKHADQIIVLEKGEVKEVGNHEQLVANRNQYYELVKNQLELAK